MNRCLLALLLTSSVLLGQQNLTEIPPQDPAIEQASFKVAKGFEVNLWAADPLLAKPTQISFDHEGRLWVASSETYPQLNVNQEPNDRILILEDTDQDGSADKSSVFYDKLIIPGGSCYATGPEEPVVIAEQAQSSRSALCSTYTPPCRS